MAGGASVARWSSIHDAGSMGRPSHRLPALLAVFFALLVAFLAIGHEPPAPAAETQDAAGRELDAETPADTAAAPDAALPVDAGPRAPPSGRFRYVEDERPATLMPIFAESPSEYRLRELLFDGLLLVGEDGAVEGRLATAWSLDPDALGLRFTLRREVKWHDGAPFTADDVRFTVAAAQDPGTQFVAKARFDFIRAVEVEDTHHVNVVFWRPIRQPAARFDFKILPAHAFATPAIRREQSFVPVGTGSYRYVDQSPRQIRLAANPDAWAPPHFAEVDMDNALTKSAQLNLLEYSAFKAGVLLVPWVPPSEFPRLGATEAAAIELFRTGAWWFVAFNHARPALAEHAVREAMSLALDRRDLVESWVGRGAALTGPFAEGDPRRDAEVTAPVSDVARANDLLDAAGWVRDRAGRHKGGARLEFTLAIDKDRIAAVPLSDAFQRAWAEIGVRVRPRFLTRAAFRDQVLTRRTFDLALHDWKYFEVDDLRPLFHGRGALNFTNYRNDSVDTLLDRLGAAHDDSTQVSLSRQLHALLATDLPYLFLFAPTFYSGVSRVVENVSLTPGTCFGSFSDWRFRAR